jgi:hypothetical protein
LPGNSCFIRDIIHAIDLFQSIKPFWLSIEWLEENAVDDGEVTSPDFLGVIL